jgi:isopenicillin N synthase-like dioxygenase
MWPLLLWSLGASQQQCADAGARPGVASVPIISLAHAEPVEVDRALRTVGFIAIVDHGVDERVIDRAWRSTAEWFGRPRAEKEQAPLLAPDYPYGYSPLRSEVHLGSADDARARAADASPPLLADEKEMWCIGPDNDEAPARRWPEDTEELREAWLAYFAAMESLSDRILSLFAKALGLEDETFFERFNRKHASALRAINYPELARELAPGQLRASAHTDYGALTILRVGGPGLQIFNRDNEWVDVPLIDGIHGSAINGSSFVINLGDLMSRWTNDRWLSTPHRVVVPQPADAAGAIAEARQALAYFHNMDMGALIETIATCRGGGDADGDQGSKYAPIRAGEHLMKKHEAATRGETLNIYASARAI